MDFKGSVSISRGNNDKINIRIHDKASGTEFVDVEMSLENYALLITGLSRVECEGEVRGLAIVGKQKVFEQRSVVCPLNVYNKRDLEQWLVDHCQEEGWELNTYLGSQNSVRLVGDVTTLNYSVVKYV